MARKNCIKGATKVDSCLAFIVDTGASTILAIKKNSFKMQNYLHPSLMEDYLRYIAFLVFIQITVSDYHSE